MDGQFTDANAGCVIDAGGDSRGNAGKPDFANATRAKFVERSIRVVEECHVDARSVRVGRKNVVRQVAVDRRTVSRIVSRFLENRHAQAHHDRAFYLISPGALVYDTPGIDHRYHAIHAKAGQFRVPAYFRKMSPV